ENVTAARQSGATVIDLSGGLAKLPGAVAWFPGIEAPQKGNGAYTIPSAAATAAAALSLGLVPVNVRGLVFTAFQPVSEAGRAGIEELESQTSQLLSFQGVGKPVFDTQIAFTMLDRYGSESAQKLSVVRDRVRAELRLLLAKPSSQPAIQILHAPVFYGSAFSAYAELDSAANQAKVATGV